MNSYPMLDKKEINNLRKIGLVVLVATILVYITLTVKFLLQF
jgi:hypothetical protein